MSGAIETEHAVSHKNGTPEACHCWESCPCRKEPACDPRRPLDPIRDMDGTVIKAGDYVKLVPVDGHECKKDCTGGPIYLAFEYAAREVPKYPGCGGSSVDRGDFYARYCDKNGLQTDSQTHVKRRQERDLYYRKHDIRLVGKARDPQKEADDRNAKEAKAIFAKESEEVQKKYAAFSPHEFENGVFLGDVYDPDEFQFQLKAMRPPYYIEESDEYSTIEHSGFASEERAIDAFMEDSGHKHLFRWTGQVWEQAKLKRKGKEIKITWVKKENG